MDADIEITVKQCTTCHDYQQTQPQQKALPYEIPCRLWEVVGTDSFMINNKMFLCTEDYQQEVAADKQVQMAKMIFLEYGLCKKVIANAGTNFTSETLREFCRLMNIQQSVTPSYHHQSNGSVEACIKFVNCTVENALTLTKMAV